MTTDDSAEPHRDAVTRRKRRSGARRSRSNPFENGGAGRRRDFDGGVSCLGQSPVSKGGDPRSSASRNAVRPRVHSLSDETSRRLRDARRHDPSERISEGDTGPETLGQRLRRKYERAVHDAGADLAAVPSRRRDRDKLVRILQEERFLVPHEESRRALRQVARDTNSSYARVAQCDKQLADAIRRRLEADPEFVELRRRARESEDGCEGDIDNALERDLADAAAKAFVRRFRAANPVERAALLGDLLDAGASEWEQALHNSVLNLPAPARERLLRGTLRKTGLL